MIVIVQRKMRVIAQVANKCIRGYKSGLLSTVYILFYVELV